MRVEREWNGIPACIVAGGESFSLKQARLIGIARSRNLLRVIAVNDAVYPCWYADIAYACDWKWWKMHGELHRFGGRKIRLRVPTGGGNIDTNNPGEIPGLDFLDAGPETGLSEDPSVLHTGLNSGYQALNLAVHLGSPKILLVGFDMQKQTHWFGDHPEEVKKVDSDFPRWRKTFETTLKPLSEKNITVINCSPGSALQCFKWSDLEKELKVLEAERG